MTEAFRVATSVMSTSELPGYIHPIDLSICTSHAPQERSKKKGIDTRYLPSNAMRSSVGFAHGRGMARGVHGHDNQPCVVVAYGSQSLLIYYSDLIWAFLISLRPWPGKRLFIISSTGCLILCFLRCHIESGLKGNRHLRLLYVPFPYCTFP